MAAITCNGHGAQDILQGSMPQINKERRTKNMDKSQDSRPNLARQMLRILGFNMIAIFVILVVFYFMLISMQMVKILEILLGFLSLTVYCLIMAATAKGIADKEILLKQEKGMYPAKGLVLASTVVILNLLIFSAVKLSWSLNAPELLRLVFQILFFVLTLPYNFFLDISGQSITGVGVILLFTIPFVSIGAGYYAGYKKWDIFEKLDKIVFENKK